MKKILLCIALILIFMLSGCSKVTELDAKSFVTAVGIDKGENYSFKYTFVFTNPSKNSSSNSKELDETIVIEAPSLYSAIEQLDSFTSKRVELTHTQTIVFSDELAKMGIGDIITMFVRSNHFRPNTYVCVAENSAMEFLKSVNPQQAFHLEKYFQQLFSKMTSGTGGDMYLYDSYFKLCSNEKSFVLPYCAINKTKPINSGEESPTESSEQPSETETVSGKFVSNTDDYAINTLAGDTISDSKNTAEIRGVCVFKDAMSVGLLGRRETTMLQLIGGSMPDNYITISDPKNPDDMITCYVVQNRKPTIDISCGEEAVIDITIYLEGDFSLVGSDSFYIKNPTLFEEYFENKTEESLKAFLEKISRDFGCDVCGFSEIAKTNFMTVDKWENYNWAKKFPKARFNINVDFTVRSYGELSQTYNGVVLN